MVCESNVLGPLLALCMERLLLVLFLIPPRGVSWAKELEEDGKPWKDLICSAWTEKSGATE